MDSKQTISCKVFRSEYAGTLYHVPENRLVELLDQCKLSKHSWTRVYTFNGTVKEFRALEYAYAQDAQLR